MTNEIIQWPRKFIAKDSKGNKYRVAVEAYIHSILGMGFVQSDIPEQPKNVTELFDLRQKGYIIENEREIKK